MNGAVDISYAGLAFALLLFTVPAVVSLVLDLRLIGTMLISALRMIVQLILVSVALLWIFEAENVFITALWFVVMVFNATFTVLRQSHIRPSIVIAPAFFSFFISNIIVLVFMIKVIIGLDNIMSPRYFIVLSGMLLGNSLRSNIVALTSFYKELYQRESEYLYRLSCGASLMEAVLPQFREALKRALSPTIATMATMGIVSLPGMMTGQILGGSSPVVAVKYQIVIMIAIFVAVSISNTLTILITLKSCFLKSGVLRKDIFIEAKR